MNPITFATWYDKFTQLDPVFECKGNEDMESILQFFVEPTDAPIDPLQCRASQWARLGA
jgi:hypothetical protein